jgi:hypothetical protein
MERETYPIEIAGVNRNLRLFEIKPGLRIAILNILVIPNWSLPVRVHWLKSCRMLITMCW